MNDDLDTKVVLRQAFLSGRDGLAQRVATVYMNGQEYRVYAPPEASGNALDWVKHFSIRQLVNANTEKEITDVYGEFARKRVKEELERQGLTSTELLA